MLPSLTELSWEDSYSGTVYTSKKEYSDRYGDSKLKGDILQQWMKYNSAAWQKSVKDGVADNPLEELVAYVYALRFETTDRLRKDKGTALDKKRLAMLSELATPIKHSEYYRAVSVSAFEDMFGRNLQVGDEFIDKGLCSVSSSIKGEYEFLAQFRRAPKGGHILMILNPKNKIDGIDITGVFRKYNKLGLIHKFAAHDEIILLPNIKFTCKSIEKATKKNKGNVPGGVKWIAEMDIEQQ